MLARFENGYFLEVVVEKDTFGFHQYVYRVLDVDGDTLDDGWTEYRSMDLYHPMNEIDYILEYCEPDYVEGKYEILECTLEEFIAQNRYDFENDTEDILIQKALNKDELYVCVADQEYVIYVIAGSELDADGYAYDYYCEECFEPGHWKCLKANEIFNELNDCDVLIYDEDNFFDGEWM